MGEGGEENGQLGRFGEVVEVLPDKIIKAFTRSRICLVELRSMVTAIDS